VNFTEIIRNFRCCSFITQGQTQQLQSWSQELKLSSEGHATLPPSMPILAHYLGLGSGSFHPHSFQLTTATRSSQGTPFSHNLTSQSQTEVPSPAVLTEVSNCFPQSLQANSGIIFAPQIMLLSVRYTQLKIYIKKTDWKGLF
jgi:hypothetical protein